MPTDPSSPADPHWAALKPLFEQALELPPAARDAFVAAARCSEAVRAELRSLLAHHARAADSTGFLAAEAAQALAGATGGSVAQADAGSLGLRLGPWQLVRLLGRGGMGEVYEAQRADGSYQGRAAVKLLRRGLDSAAVLQRFAQERQALAQLEHPHIARLLDAGAAPGGSPYFVMAYVEGRPIDQAVKGQPLRQRLTWMLQLCDAVAHAHRQLLVHRDLKPGNVLVDAQGQVQLLDFGIAKALQAGRGADERPDADAPAAVEASATHIGQQAYTPHYASPEQVRGERVGTATDIYSLGVLLYELLTGLRPTGRRATTPAELLRSVLEEVPTRPSHLGADLPSVDTHATAVDPQWLRTRKTLQGDLDHILLKALEKDPARRYASVDALAADLRAFLDGRPVSARPATPGYRLRRFVARNRLPVALGVAALLALLGGLAGTAWQWQRAEAARTEQAQRYAQLRAQAQRLLFDYHDQALLLPGSTALVQRLLQDSRTHLEGLAQAAGDDPALLRELGVAQRRLGELHASPGRAALGDSTAALAWLQRAVQTLESAWAREPDRARSAAGPASETAGLTANETELPTRYQLAIAQAALGTQLQEAGRGAEAVAWFEASGQHFDALAAAAPLTEPYRVEQLRTRLRQAELFGNTAGGLGQPAAAQAALDAAGALLEPLMRDFPGRRTIERLVTSTRNLRYLAAAHEGQWAEGLALLDGNRALFAQMLASTPDDSLLARDAAINQLSRGLALGELGRWAEAREASADGLARMRRLVAADPANHNARRDAAKLQTDLGHALLRLGQPGAARAELDAAVAALQALAAKDPADRRVATLLAAARVRQAEALARDPALPLAARRAGVQAATQEAIAALQALVARAPADANAARQLALAQQVAAQAFQDLGAAGQAPSCGHWRASQAQWEALQASGRLRRGDNPRLALAQQAAMACR